MKRIKNNRKNQRNKIVQENRTKLLKQMAEISKGLTPPEIRDAHIDFYFTCNNAEKLMLNSIFAELEDKMQTDICHFFKEQA